MTDEPPDEGAVARSFREIALPAYGPTLLNAIGTGAALPVIVTTAHDLGASSALAALIVALIGVGQLMGSFPAGAITARIGERRGLIFAAAVACIGAVGAMVSPTVPVLAASVLCMGLATSVFNLARQSFLIALIPKHSRGRAMSTLGGINRIGMFIGPVVGAVAITRLGPQAAYGITACASLGVIVLVLTVRDLTSEYESLAPAHGVSMLTVLKAHRTTFATVGIGNTLLAAARTVRIAIIPLWAADIGVPPAQASLIVGASAALDMLLFYPGGYVMDRWGRIAVAVPSMVLLGLGLITVTVTHDTTQLLMAALLLGFANGIGSGVGATLGADVAPTIGRPQFLAGWRFMFDSGAAIGPLTLSTIAATLGLASAGVFWGVVTIAGSGWIGYWLRRRDGPTRTRARG